MILGKLNRARAELAENQSQLDLHERAYENNLVKIKQAGRKLAEVRDTISAAPATSSAPLEASVTSTPARTAREAT
jgi:CHASE3 domain sensor protein